MRVRILKAHTGIIEGHSLSQFVPGFVYELEEALGLQLIELGAAIAVRSTDRVDDIDVARFVCGIHAVPRDKADDRPERRRRKPRKP